MLALSLAPSTAHAQPKYAAADVKAQFVERFTRLIDWPSSMLERKDFTLCVLGDGATVAALKQFVTYHKIKQRRAVVVELEPDTDLSACWALFISASGRAVANELLPKLERKPVLTIGDSSTIADLGVMMSFYQTGSRLRFEIDPKRINDSGLKARSKLLRLGRQAKRSR